MPFDAQLLAGNRAREELHRALLGIGMRARTERAEIEPVELLATVAKRGGRLGVGIHDGRGFDVDDENGILGGVEYRAVARLRHAQGFIGALALGDVLGDGERHGVEGAAQPAELVASPEAAAGGKAALGELLGGMHQPRGPPRQQEVEHQPHRERERRHPSRPVERLPEHLGARFRLVALEVVGEEQAAGPSGTELVGLTAHQDAGIAQQLVAVRVHGHSGATLADGDGGRLEIELRQDGGDRLSQPRPSGRLDDDVPIVRQRGERDLVVVRQHRDLAMRRRGVALEQQVLQRALQAGHLLGQSLAAALLRRAFGLRHVIEQVHRAQDRGEAQQDERDRG